VSFRVKKGMSGVLVELTAYKNGVKTSKLVARTNGHAGWVEWVN